ncbi:extracellular solute-binding protein [Paenibacillus daejeonensis]|uniref:extracellular solute-binding protein n=1 Tax=Paenibacillus daejeonensis TaxID=135193 RepID=UPI000361AB3B|nr:extracellular solute-binding protein [Paenibacillus daejeonensis]
MLRRIAIVCTIIPVLAAVVTGCSAGTTAEGATVTVYSSRHYAADQALYSAFTEQTGIRVIEKKGTSQELMSQLSKEDEAHSADVLITVDVAALAQAKHEDLLQPILSEKMEAHVPAQWRDPDGTWVGVAARARVIVYAKDRVDGNLLASYDDLADEEWYGRLLMRSSGNQYNLSLLASLIDQRGEAAARHWVEGIAHNLATDPQGGDREQALQLAKGTGDVSVMNTYYIGQMLASDNWEERQAAGQLGMVFPNAEHGGTHINLSGIGLLREAPNPSAAIQLIEFLTSQEAQTALSGSTYEYPVHPQAAVPEVLQQWGEPEPQAIDYNRLDERQSRAVELVSNTDWQ